VKYKAVIFDLFGTLVCDLVGPKYTDTLTRMARVLSIPADDFLKKWSDTAYERNTGAFLTVEANLVHICEEAGVQPEDDEVKLAARIRQDYARRVMIRPRSGAVEVLSRLKQMGYKFGLISNCTPDAPVVWSEIPLASLFDVVVFSSSAHLMKPDRQIYKLALDLLGVSAKDCIYVANGHNNELRAAYELGMHPVLVTPGTDEEFAYMQPEDEETSLAEREGAVISSLKEVLDLVE
jgi:HAD superfamily hydrolase (TIGR01509 family)